MIRRTSGFLVGNSNSVGIPAKTVIFVRSRSEGKPLIKSKNMFCLNQFLEDKIKE